ncbi:MAG: hypothetical protein WD273_14965 [Trueperaceae bacterium]
MNRQFRRAQDKQDKKQEKEKTRKREERRAKVRQLRKSRSSESVKRQSGLAEGDEQRPVRRGRVPGRFAGVLAAVTVFFITLQSVAPAEQQEAGLATSLIAAGFYLMLGYFATLWFMRRETTPAPLYTIAGGTLLAGSVTVAQLVQGRPLDLLALALVIPALILGALLGRLVFRATPR